MSKATCISSCTLALALLSAVPHGLFAETDKASSKQKQGYERFTLVRTRNIFDPDRQANTPVAGSSPAPKSANDFAALTGTLITENKATAFFSGSRPEFNKVLQIHGEIAGARLVQITANTVVVERDGKPVTVAVGQTVPLDSKSAPTAAPVTSTGSVPSASASSASTVQATFAPGTLTEATYRAGASSVSKEEIIRRMMEKRQKELK